MPVVSRCLLYFCLAVLAENGFCAGSVQNSTPLPANTLANAIQVDAANGKYSATLDGKPIARQAAFMEPAADVNRLCFRTGDVYTEPTRNVSRDLGGRDFPNADTPVPAAVYNIDDVSVD